MFSMVGSSNQLLPGYTNAGFSIIEDASSSEPVNPNQWKKRESIWTLFPPLSIFSCGINFLLYVRSSIYKFMFNRITRAR